MLGGLSVKWDYTWKGCWSYDTCTILYAPFTRNIIHTITITKRLYIRSQFSCSLFLFISLWQNVYTYVKYTLLKKQKYQTVILAYLRYVNTRIIVSSLLKRVLLGVTKIWWTTPPRNDSYRCD